jgi:hypothetical protein
MVFVALVTADRCTVHPRSPLESLDKVAREFVSQNCDVVFASNPYAIQAVEHFVLAPMPVSEREFPALARSRAPV